MKILSNFPYSPFGRSAGSTQRFNQIILGLRELGHDIRLWSFKNPSGYQWDDTDLDRATKLGIEVVLTERGKFDPRVLDGVDFVCGVYFHYMKFYEQFNGPKCVETADLLTCNFQIDEAFGDSLSKEGDIFCFSRDSFAKEPKYTEYPIRDEELEVYRKYRAIMISIREQERLAKKGIKSTYIPYIPTIPNQTSDYSGNPCYLASAHLNNIYGNDLLGIRLLPMMRLKSPIEFNTVGEVKDVCRKFPGINYKGYTSYQDDLLTATFGISPLFYGTGYQLKISTYMAYGVPPIIFSPRQEKPLEHDVNCLVADTYEEFSDHCVRLWSNRNEAKRLGTNARETMKSYYTHEQMLNSLQEIIDTSHGNSIFNSNV